MKKILLVYLPFCTPASPPYSITNLYSFLSANCSHDINVLDLNLKFHTLKFPKYQAYYQKGDWEDYEQVTKEYKQLTRKTYSENNKKVLHGETPEFFDELIQQIRDKKPDIVLYSIVYSSQVFYAYALLKELQDIVSVVGGPAVNDKLIGIADKTFPNEIELLNFIQERKMSHDELKFKNPLDFSIYNLEEYFAPQSVIPIKTTTTCYYKRCTFCTHFSDTKYYEFPLDVIKKTISNSKRKYFFLIDDMIPTKRLLEIAKTVKPLGIHWTCQLKPKKSLTYDTLQTLKDSGLIMILWGVESGNQRILDLMKKGTEINDIQNVLEDSHKAGIKNVTYIMFGFPTETKEEFLDTINFLKRNQDYIDLVSVSVFGLQKGTPIYTNPKEFGISKIIEKERKFLGAQISYELSVGLTQEQANRLRKRHKATIEKINNYPNTMNFFREHMISLI